MEEITTDGDIRSVRLFFWACRIVKSLRLKEEEDENRVKAMKRRAYGSQVIIIITVEGNKQKKKMAQRRKIRKRIKKRERNSR
jgi:hypothetical protein